MCHVLRSATLGSQLKVVASELVGRSWGEAQSERDPGFDGYNALKYVSSASGALIALNIFDMSVLQCASRERLLSQSPGHLSVGRILSTLAIDTFPHPAPAIPS